MPVDIDALARKHAPMSSGRLLAALATAVLALVASRATASEIGHYAGGLPNVRDLAVPEPGFYGVAYNYYYTTGQLNDSRGREIDTLTLRGPRGGRLNLKLDVDVDVYVLAPAFMWVSDWEILGARYAAYVTPTFSNTSVGAALDTETDQGINPGTSQFGIGDLYVQPVWLGWTLEHFDFAFGLGFYAPVGKYDVHTVQLPGLGPVKVESADNIGLGFWTQQTQLAGYWYPFVNRATAVGVGLTHEINTKKRDFDLTPGQNLTLNWGASQYLPLTTDQHLLMEIGPAGYDTWQVTDDTGSDATSPGVHDQVHAVGAQLGLTYVPWNLAMNFHWFYEYAATNRFQGEALGLSLAKKF